MENINQNIAFIGMTYNVDVMWCASEIARGAKKAGFSGDYYELEVADLEFLRGDQGDSLESLPFADESTQKAFEVDVEKEINRLLSE
jgi:hypothetical protein